MKKSIRLIALRNKLKTADLDQIKKQLSRILVHEEYLSFQQNLLKIEILDWHYLVANRQRQSYNSMKQNLPSDVLFIELDWKEKLVIGMSPRQISEEFYNQKQRTLLGFGIYNRVSNGIKCLNINIISDHLGQKCSDVISAFK